MRSWRLLLFVLCATVASQLLAQQAPMFTDFSRAYTVINPSFSGMNQGINVMGINRMQWAGFGIDKEEIANSSTTSSSLSDDQSSMSVAPETFFLSVDMPVKFLHGGVGLSLMEDNIGFEENTSVTLNYAYHIDLGLSDLGMGLGLNILNRTVDFTRFNPIDPDDPVLQGLAADASDMFLDMNFGVFWQIPGEVYLGFSATNILETEGSNLLSESATTSASFIGDRTFYLFGGYEFQLNSIPQYSFLPSFCVMSDIASTQIEAGIRAIYNNVFWFGVNYRHEESVGFLAGLNIKDIQIGYSYDLNTMGLTVPGSHEISFRYCFKLNSDKAAREYKSVRYL